MKGKSLLSISETMGPTGMFGTCLSPLIYYTLLKLGKGHILRVPINFGRDFGRRDDN